METFTGKISSSLNEMRRTSVGTNVILICKEKQFSAHRLILSAGSPYWKKKFETELTEANTYEIDFSDISETTLASILEFLYLSDPAKLTDKTFEDLMEIYNTVRLFEIGELFQFTLELISKQMNIENYLTIWNMRIKYEQNDNCEDILSFIIGNLRSVVLKEEFLKLSYDQMKLLLKAIYDRQIHTEDYLLVRIVVWMNKEATRMEKLDLFYYMNFERVTEKCMNRLRKREHSFFDSVFRKLDCYFKIHVFPKLITDGGMKIHPSVMETKYKTSPLKLFLIGHYFEIENGVISTTYEAMKIVEMQRFEGKTTKSIIRLNMSMKNVKFCFHSNSLFYFISQDSVRLSLTGYDYKSNSIFFNIDMPEHINILSTYCSDKKVYIIGQQLDNYNSHEYIVFCISEIKGIWNSSKHLFHAEGEFVACFNLEGFLLILHKRNNTERNEYERKNKKENNKNYEITKCYYLTKVSKNSSYHTQREFPPLKTKLSLDKKFIKVSNRKLYAFVFKHSVCTCVEFQPRHNHWNIFEVTTQSNDVESIQTCYSTKDHGILFSTHNDILLQFDAKEHSIKPFWLDTFHLYNDHSFVREINMITRKIFIIPEEEEEIKDTDTEKSVPQCSIPLSRLLLIPRFNDDLLEELYYS